MDLLKSVNIVPEIVLAHSSGEIAAGYEAELFDRPTALETSHHRGFMSQLCAQVISSRGAMMAVGLG